MARPALLLILPWLILAPYAGAQKPFSLEDLMRTPFPANLTAARITNRLAWTFNQEGRRNVWVAEGPEFGARQLTKYEVDDGQELSELRFSSDGATLVYVRGGEKYDAGRSPNPSSNPGGAEQAIWQMAWNGGEAKRVDTGHSPVLSARGAIAYIKEGQVWIVPLSGDAQPQQIVVRGRIEDPRWSPDGSKLAFVSVRENHAFIGIYDLAEKTVWFLSPSVDSDQSPRWAEDGKRIAFVRRPAARKDALDLFFIAPDRPSPWAVWIADASTGNGRELWRSGEKMTDSFPEMAEETGGGVLNWATNDQLIIASEKDGWQHLYSVSANDGSSKLITLGACEIERWSFTPDREKILFSSNCDDINRRHLWSATLTGNEPVRLTSGEGIEWNPVMLSDGITLAYLASDATHPARPLMINLKGTGKPVPLATETWPKRFPAADLIVPQPVILHSSDGAEVHAQLFLPHAATAGEKRPAILFLHGGPMRQMLLGWHYTHYYANSYAMNQYLASRGYIVLAVNYRSGIGYGRSFHVPAGRAARGATEYQDVVAGGEYLRGREDVDPERIGLWGGSYGGFLTALGLARNSDLFAAGVDFHGVHDWREDVGHSQNISSEQTQLALESSPVNAVKTWRSPVLFIHGDDDHSVDFTQTVDLVARLREQNVAIEQLIFPDDGHDFLLYRHWIEAYRATVDFFDRHFRVPDKK